MGSKGSAGASARQATVAPIWHPAPPALPQPASEMREILDRRNADARGRRALLGIAAVALWTIVVAYGLPPWLGRSPVRLLGYLLGAALSFAAAWRLGGGPTTRDASP